MPQAYEGGAVFLAQAVLAESKGGSLATATLLSPRQLAIMRRSMEGAHRVRRIPAGNAAYLDRARSDGRFDMSRTIGIDDEKLHYIWNRFREHGVMVVEALTRRPQALLVANRLVAGFHSPECRFLLRQYRAQYDRRQQGSDEKAAQLRRAIVTCIDARIDSSRGGAVLQALFGS